MAGPDPRRLLIEGVEGATLMQVATLSAQGAPVLCQVWYRAGFDPDRLYFMSREDRAHVLNVRADGRVAAAIALHVPGGLGERVRGVTLTGSCRPVADFDLPAATAAFTARWPRAGPALGPAPGPGPVAPQVRRCAGGAVAVAEAPRSRLYEIAVVQWVLFDEVNYPDRPRIELAAVRLQGLP